MIELLVSMGILAIIFAISVIALSTAIPATSQNTAYDILISDLRLQQTKAMANDASYGVHFESNSYTLFQGSSYNPNDPANFAVTLDPTLGFSNISFPGNQIVFLPASGDVSGYLEGENSVLIANSVTNKTTPVKINKYGATY